jgi:hypothetical protein
MILISPGVQRLTLPIHAGWILQKMTSSIVQSNVLAAEFDAHAYALERTGQNPPIPCF